jgi:hypothetical protein
MKINKTIIKVAFITSISFVKQINNMEVPLAIGVRGAEAILDYAIRPIGQGIGRGAAFVRDKAVIAYGLAAAHPKKTFGIIAGAAAIGGGVLYRNELRDPALKSLKFLAKNALLCAPYYLAADRLIGSPFIQEQFGFDISENQQFNHYFKQYALPFAMQGATALLGHSVFKNIPGIMMKRNWKTYTGGLVGASLIGVYNKMFDPPKTESIVLKNRLKDTFRAGNYYWKMEEKFWNMLQSLNKKLKLIRQQNDPNLENNIHGTVIKNENNIEQACNPLFNSYKIINNNNINGNNTIFFNANNDYSSAMGVFIRTLLVSDNNKIRLQRNGGAADEMSINYNQGINFDIESIFLRIVFSIDPANALIDPVEPAKNIISRELHDLLYFMYYNSAIKGKTFQRNPISQDFNTVMTNQDVTLEDFHEINTIKGIPDITRYEDFKNNLEDKQKIFQKMSKILAEVKKKLSQNIQKFNKKLKDAIDYKIKTIEYLMRYAESINKSNPEHFYDIMKNLQDYKSILLNWNTAKALMHYALPIAAGATISNILFAK